MVRAPNRKRKQGNDPTRLGVRAAARQIGVSHSHLSRVLRGVRASRSLMRRYRKLQEAA